ERVGVDGRLALRLHPAVGRLRQTAVVAQVGVGGDLGHDHAVLARAPDLAANLVLHAAKERVLVTSEVLLDDVAYDGTHPRAALEDGRSRRPVVVAPADQRGRRAPEDLHQLGRERDVGALHVHLGAAGPRPDHGSGQATHEHEGPIGAVLRVERAEPQRPRRLREGGRERRERQTRTPSGRRALEQSHEHTPSTADVRLLSTPWMKSSATRDTTERNLPDAVRGIASTISTWMRTLAPRRLPNARFACSSSSCDQPGAATTSTTIRSTSSWTIWNSRTRSISRST